MSRVVIIRWLDVFLSSSGLVIMLPFLIVGFIASWMDTGSPIFRQERVGINKRPFILYKFRTMKVGTAQVGSHLINSDRVSNLGRFMRKLKVDELPQLVNVIAGDMSLVGPRPCLASQLEVIELRDAVGIFEVKPGITGLAQLRKVNMSTPDELAVVDRQMLDKLNVLSYLGYLLLTLKGAGSGDAILRDH